MLSERETELKPTFFSVIFKEESSKEYIIGNNGIIYGSYEKNGRGIEPKKTYQIFFGSYEMMGKKMKKGSHKFGIEGLTESPVNKYSVIINEDGLKQTKQISSVKCIFNEHQLPVGFIYILDPTNLNAIRYALNR